MTQIEQREELLALVEASREQLAYASELGISLMEESALETIAAPQAASTDAPSIYLNQSVPSPLQRNAEAAEGSVSVNQSASAKGGYGSTQRTGGEDSSMAKKSSRTTLNVEPPAEETLFGVVTPRDEASLPKPGETLQDIWNDIGECTRCPLCESRTQVVNSHGNPKARLMFVGEAPGADEDAQGIPFVGRAGQLLNKIIEAIGLKREDVFIGNVNRCRPPQNRTPTIAEAAICKPFLLREIAVVEPEVIVVLGNTAMKNLLDTKEGITKVRGIFQDFGGIKVMPTFHPAYLLRDPSKKRETWEDMKKVRDYLDSTARS
jgi:uracil-DNA glycosylase family 4